jgi:Family of unknown function (DUF6279)
MITTLSAMRQSFLAKAAIIGVLLLTLSGCSALRLAYANGQQLAWWWIDGYIDFSSEQTPRAKEAIDRLFEWHRATQLPEYAATLATAAVQITEPTTPAAVCQWQRRLRDAVEPALEKSLQLGADLVPALGEAEFRHLEKRFATNRGDMRDNFMQPNAEDRRKAALKRTVERVEQLYGRIGDAQRNVILAGLAASPFDADAWFAERERRQKDTVQTLRRLVAEKAPRDQVVAAMRTLVERTERSPDVAYRAYQQRLADFNCAFAAQIHNATTPAQRAAARDRLKGWEEDLRSFLVPAGAG